PNPARRDRHRRATDVRRHPRDVRRLRHAEYALAFPSPLAAVRLPFSFQQLLYRVVIVSTPTAFTIPRWAKFGPPLFWIANARVAGPAEPASFLLLELSLHPLQTDQPGFPSPDETTDILLALEDGGADVIELGIPFTDPVADGPTIQEASEVALRHDVDIPRCLELVARSRSRGLKAPVVLMGYYNPILNYGEAKLVEDSPSTSDKRIAQLAKVADSFIYVVSKFGVTGASDAVDAQLPALMARIRAQTDAPLAVGFGVGHRSQFELIGERSDGVVIGSQIITVLKNTGSYGSRCMDCVHCRE
ncbi:MAG: hypothetical protein BJ554DRAFT_7756, partial [Olpidium bornovanus]